LSSFLFRFVGKTTICCFALCKTPGFTGRMRRPRLRTVADCLCL